MRAPRPPLFIVLALIVAGCSTPLSTREKGAVVGGAVGAGAGAAIGSASGHAGTGALIGAGVGVLSGALIGDAMQASEQQQATAPPPAPAPVAPAPPAAVPPPPQVAMAAPPPIVVTSPQYVWVPQWGVYVLDGHDVVYHDGLHYYWHGGHWFVSRSHGGPWARATARPVVLSKVPPGHFHRSLPPGLQKKGKVPPGHRR